MLACNSTSHSKRVVGAVSLTCDVQKMCCLSDFKRLLPQKSKSRRMVKVRRHKTKSRTRTKGVK